QYFYWITPVLLSESIKVLAHASPPTPFLHQLVNLFTRQLLKTEKCLFMFYPHALIILLKHPVYRGAMVRVSVRVNVMIIFLIILPQITQMNTDVFL
ncbi:hypothetical protein, partial [uncultured Prevotella sp.]|uniref:hypothetical protein n=1 Tax=uncultured Prevotella sp. TaxID=159272 RepID=UPI00260666B8